jgi:hypothetical protein
MNASRRSRRRFEPALVRWASEPAPDPKPIVVPADSSFLHRDRAVVPFVVVEHESGTSRRIGILVLDPAAA